MSIEEQLDSRILAACSRFGQVGVGRIKDELKVPYPPASRPGQHPHRRSGNLQSGVIVLELSQAGPQTTVSLAILATYAEYLRNGTKRMQARPYADEDDLLSLFVDTLQEEFTGA